VISSVDKGEKQSSTTERDQIKRDGIKRAIDLKTGEEKEIGWGRRRRDGQVMAMPIEKGQGVKVFVLVTIVGRPPPQPTAAAFETFLYQARKLYKFSHHLGLV